MSAKAVIFDLDDTLVDTRALREFRESRSWREAVAQARKSSLFPGIADLLSRLATQRVSIAVVTTSVSYYAAAVLKHHAISPHVLIAYHDAPRKPRPDPVILALERLKLKASDVIGVGDSVVDCTAYRAAKVHSVGAVWSPVFSVSDWQTLAREPMHVADLCVS